MLRKNSGNCFLQAPELIYSARKVKNQIDALYTSEEKRDLLSGGTRTRLLPQTVKEITVIKILEGSY